MTGLRGDSLDSSMGKITQERMGAFKASEGPQAVEKMQSADWANAISDSKVAAAFTGIQTLFKAIKGDHPRITAGQLKEKVAELDAAVSRAQPSIVVGYNKIYKDVTGKTELQSLQSTVNSLHRMLANLPEDRALEPRELEALALLLNMTGDNCISWIK